MNLKNKIKDDLKISMKSGDTVSRDVLRMLNSEIKNKEIELIRELSDDEVIKIIRGSVKRRKDSVEQYTKGHSADLAGKEENEIKVLQIYLPVQMSEDKAREIVRDIIKKMGYAKSSDFGSAMKEAVTITKGEADGKMLSSIIKAELNG